MDIIINIFALVGFIYVGLLTVDIAATLLPKAKKKRGRPKKAK